VAEWLSLKKTTILDILITSDLSNINDKNPWKGAKAYHFYD
jgi:hypothetical protein